MSLGDLFGTDDSEAQNYLQQALQQYQNVSVPTVASETVSNLPQETVQGTVNPNQIQTATQAPTAYNDISLDPQTRQAQINALNSYQGIANAGGLDANAKLGLQQTVDAANIQSQGAQGAIMNNAQAMGQGGGDFALTQRAIASQGASNNAATQGMQAAAEAEANREAALNQMATIGGNVNASDYSQAANKAASTNTINASNTAATNAANTQNVANNMTGQQFNVTNAQGVNAANTTANQGNAYYNAALPQQQFNNEMAKAGGMAGVNQNQAGVAQQSQANAANATGQLLKGGTALAATALGGPVGGMVSNAMLGNGGQPLGTTSAIAGTNAYQQNTNKNNPNLMANGGVCGYADGGTPHNHYMCMLMGGKVPGEAVSPGDNKANDTQPAMLSPGELVIPRSVPKDGKHMEEFAKKAPIGGDKSKRVDMTGFTKGYKKGSR